MQFDNLSLELDWSANIPDVVLSGVTGGASASYVFSVSVDGKSVFSQAFTGASSSTTFFGIRDIVMEYMRKQRLFTATLAFTVRNTSSQVLSRSVNYVYGWEARPAEEYIVDNFLESSSGYLIPGDGEIRANYITPTPPYQPFVITGVGVNSLGEQHFYQREIPGNNFLNITVDKLATAVGLETILSATVTVGNRQVSYFVAELGHVRKFIFMNRHNIPEVAYIGGNTLFRSEFSRNFAVMSGRRTAYDYRVERYYELTSEELPLRQVEILEELASSWEVTDADNNPILLTETAFEYSDNGYALQSVKISWQYADDYVGRSAKPRRIFTDEFSNQFS